MLFTRLSILVLSARVCLPLLRPHLAAILRVCLKRLSFLIHLRLDVGCLGSVTMSLRASTICNIVSTPSWRMVSSVSSAHPAREQRLCELALFA